MINNNIKKLYQQATGLIEGLDDNIQLLSVGFIVSDEFCFKKCNVYCSQVSLAWTTIPLPNRQGNRVKHLQLLQDQSAWRMTFNGNEVNTKGLM